MKLKEREGKTGRQANIQVDRQRKEREGKTGRQADIQADRQTETDKESTKLEDPR